AERPYFETNQKPTTTTQETWLTVRLNSVTKTTNRGFLFLMDGTRATYTYVGNTPAQLYKMIAHDGAVRIRCTAYMDENLKPTSVDIYDLEPMQGHLFEPEGEEPGVRT